VGLGYNTSTGTTINGVPYFVLSAAFAGSTWPALQPAPTGTPNTQGQARSVYSQPTFTAAGNADLSTLVYPVSSPLLFGIVSGQVVAYSNVNTASPTILYNGPITASTSFVPAAVSTISPEIIITSPTLNKVVNAYTTY